MKGPKLYSIRTYTFSKNESKQRKSLKIKNHKSAYGAVLLLPAPADEGAASLRRLAACSRNPLLLRISKELQGAVANVCYNCSNFLI